jgi:hypothetical protein
MHQPLQAAMSLPDGHLQGVQGQVGSDREACQPTRQRLKASMTKAT